MPPKTVFIHNQPLVLQPSQLIQSGGEGMVFGVGPTAVKLYHTSQPHHAAKLTHLCQSSIRWPVGVLAPSALVQDAQGRIVGFQMTRLPPGAVPLKQLGSTPFCQKQGITVAQKLVLLRQMHYTLSQLHQAGVVVGDLNEQNVHVAPAEISQSYWLDVDSYQVGAYPCPVAALPFLDPQLYGVADFATRPYFTPRTDWYAYLVLLVKTLIGAHPYGGTHPQHKSLIARAQAGITLADSGVIYPPNARPLESLSDELLHEMQRVFAQGQRGVFPLRLLEAYAADLMTCAQCGLAYPRQRRSCPACQKPLPTLPVRPTGAWRTLLQGEGLLEWVRVLRNGRVLAITHQAHQYTLIHLGVGGVLARQPLFDGRASYRFALCQPQEGALLLAVNPPGGTQLLLLEVGGAQPRQVTMLETGLFRETAVFAATSTHLYRIAGSWIMRGTLRGGLYVEDAFMTAHKNQTWFSASPYDETLAGYHRIFAEARCFIWHNGASHDVALPSLLPGEGAQEMDVGFGQTAVAFWRVTQQRGQASGQTFVTDERGRIVQTMSEAVPHFPFTTNPALASQGLRLLPPDVGLDAETVVYHHPLGLLRQTADRLFFLHS